MAAVRMAVMEIGAQDVIMKVYEIAPRKGMQVIDSLRRMVPVGKDTYSENGNVPVSLEMKLLILLT